MANKLTSTETFNLAGDTAAVTVTPTPPESFPADPAGLAARLRAGRLDDSDEQARVNGWLGGTRDALELHEQLTAATGGHDNIAPVQNPEPPAEAVESPVHPGVDQALVKAV